MIDPKRREMFTELYRMAEHYEQPPFLPGDIEGNANWFASANAEWFVPFVKKYQSTLAFDLASSIVDEAGRLAKEANNQQSFI